MKIVFTNETVLIDGAQNSLKYYENGRKTKNFNLIEMKISTNKAK